MFLSLGYLFLGIFLLLVAIVDSLWTTLWVDGGAGPLSSRLTTWAWRGQLALVGRHRHATSSLFGPTILATVVLTWVLLLWAGWVFVFAAEPTSLISTRDQAPADWTGRIFFVAYSMFTMGNGDFSPNGGVWQLVASVTNGSGMLLVTLAITYVLSVIGAVVQKRAFASQVASLGESEEAILRRAWNGDDFHTLDLPLHGLASQLSVLGAQYLAYPVLQYYHAARPEKSPIVALVVLDEALTLLHHGVVSGARPNRVVLQSTRSGVETFLDTMPSAFVHAAPDDPPRPRLSGLHDEGVPVVDDDAFEHALEGESERRRKLLGLLRNDGWTWSERFS